MISPLIKLELRYRDSGNYKISGEDFFTNNNSISLDEIERTIHSLGEEEPIIVQYYGIRSIALICNEFEYSDPSSGDHSYCEITGIKQLTMQDYPFLRRTDFNDISEVLAAIRDPEIVKQRRKEAREAARKTTKAHLEKISDIEGGANFGIPSFSDNPTGFHQKYQIRKLKTDEYGNTITAPIKDDAEYFVLRLDENGKHPEHIKAGRLGIHAYADAIRSTLPDLATDLKSRYPLIS